MTFTEHYDAIVMMHDYFKQHPVVNSQHEVVMKIADRFGIEPSRKTFQRMKDDMCHVFRCSCHFNNHTKSYSLKHYNY